MTISTARKRTLLALFAAALVASACTGSDTAPSTTTSTTAPDATTTTSAPSSTTTAPPATETPASYEHAIPVSPQGIEYRMGGDDLETVIPTVLAAADGRAYVADPVGTSLWILSAEATSQVPLAPLDILNVTAMTATPDRVVLVEVVFAPERQRIHELDADGQLLRSFDLPTGARLEDGLSAVLVDDDGEIVIVLAGGAAFATVGEDSISIDQSIALGGSTVQQVDQDYLIGGQLVTADLSGSLGGLRILGSGAGTIVLAREDVLSLAPIEVLFSVEWYEDTEFAGSALVPLGGVAGPVAPGVTVTDDGRVLILIAGTDDVVVTELTPGDTRIVAEGP